ncbi:MAG: hypothetical protein WCK37_01730 [Candidatus Falkowbacteria bacterium]
MKSSFIISLLVISLISTNMVSAQETPEPSISKWFPGLSWKDYITQKAIVWYLDYNGKSKLIPAESKFLYNSAEEKDSNFASQVIKYFNSPQNLKQVIGWLNSKIKKYPFVKQQVAEDDIKRLVTTEFSGIIPQDEIDEMDLQNMAKANVVVEKITNSKTKVGKH